MFKSFRGPSGPKARLRLAISSLGMAVLIGVRAASAAPLGGPLPGLPFPLPKLPFGSKFHLLDATIDDAQSAIRSHQLTCSQLVEFYLARIKAYNGVCVSQPSGQLG